jgi:hypothetical protein
MITILGWCAFLLGHSLVNQIKEEKLTNTEQKISYARFSALIFFENKRKDKVDLFY